MKNEYKIILILFLFTYNTALFNASQNEKSIKLERIKILRDSSELELKDMMRAPEIWTESSARMAAGISLSLESEHYRAYAYIDRHETWIKNQFKSSKELFDHELYHAKMAKVVAKEFNEEISRNNFSKYELNDKLNFYRRRLTKLQVKYDKESANSRNWIMQAYWEYKIDSMYSGGQDYNVLEEVTAYFPNPPKNHVIISLDDTISGKVSRVNKMEFFIWKFFPVKLDTMNLENWFANIVFQEDHEDKLIIVNPDIPNSLITSYSKDTLNKNKIYDNLFIDSKNTLYIARYIFPYSDENDSTFMKIGNNYFNSIKFNLK